MTASDTTVHNVKRCVCGLSQCVFVFSQALPVCEMCGVFFFLSVV